MRTFFTLMLVLVVWTTCVAAAECGNELLEAGETCAACPADCQVAACTPVGAPRSVVLSVDAPPDRELAGLTVLLAYRSRNVSLPGTAADGAVRSRVKETPADAIVAVNDRDYAVRVVVSRARPIPRGPLFTVDFDSCQGAPAATAADFACTVEGCATLFGGVDDCSCTVALR